MKITWWKILSVVLLLYITIAGLLMEVPRLVILNETVRVLYFHVPMWFGMILLLLGSVVYAIRYLRSGNDIDNIRSHSYAVSGTVFGALGIVSGMVWANYTWGEPWSGDPKQNGAAIGLLVYFAYFILRNSITDDLSKARISAIYNVFAFISLIPLLFILPRMTDSLHPGNGGNPGFNAYDLDSRLRMVFYPAVAGWTLLGVWITTLIIRKRLVDEKLDEIIA